MQDHLKQANFKLHSELSNLESVNSYNIVSLLPRSFAMSIYGVRALKLALEQIEGQQHEIN